MSREIKDLQPETAYRVAQVQCAAMALGIHLFIIEGHRPPSKQDAEYAKGRSEPGRKVTNARGGESWHNTEQEDIPSARAVDFGIRPAFKNDKQNRPNYRGYDNDPPDRILKLVADMFIQVGFEAGYYWPGERKDPPHVEYHPGFVRVRGVALRKQIQAYVNGRL